MRPALLCVCQSLVAMAALLAALVFQYGWHLPPCHFCLLQRYPYLAVLAVGAMAALFLRRHATIMRGIAWMNAALFTGSAGIAAWHSGIERGWWTSGSGCTSAIGGTTQEEVLAALMAAPLVRCDEIPWDILGLSLANLNIIYGMGAAVLSVWVLLQKAKS